MATTRYTHEYLAYVGRRHSRATFRSYKYILRRACRNIDIITPIAVENYLQSLCLRGVKAKTANLHLCVIKSYCNFLDDFYDVKNPIKRLKKMSETPPPRRNLSEQEYKKLLEANPLTDLPEGALVRLLANSGIRIGELRTIESSENPKIIYVTGKGNKRRPIPANSVVQEIISKNLINFLKSYSYRGLHKALWRASDKAGIPHCSPHTFRHFFSNRLRKAGVSIFKISRILGHASIAVTQQIYTEWQDDEVEGITDVLDRPAR